MIDRLFFPAALTLLTRWLTSAAFAAFALSACSSLAASAVWAFRSLICTFNAFTRTLASVPAAALSAEGIAHSLPLGFIEFAVAVFVELLANFVEIGSLSAGCRIRAFS